MAIELQITADGSCLGNPGPRGWPASSGRLTANGSWLAVNHRPPTIMELMAAIKTLEAVDDRSSIEIVTDSRYLRDGITRFLERWKTNAWTTAAGTAVANQDLWRRLDELSVHH